MLAHTITSLLAIHLATAPACAQLTERQKSGADFPEIYVDSSPIYLTHLSPLIQYRSGQGQGEDWVLTREIANAPYTSEAGTDAGPSFSFEYMGGLMEVLGQIRTTEWNFEPGLEQEIYGVPEVDPSRGRKPAVESGVWGTEVVNDGQTPTPADENWNRRSMVRVRGQHSTFAWRTATFYPNETYLEENEGFNVSQIRFEVPVPFGFTITELPENPDRVTFTAVAPLDGNGTIANVSLSWEAGDDYFPWGVVEIASVWVTPPGDGNDTSDGVDVDAWMPESRIQEHRYFDNTTARSIFNNTHVVTGNSTRSPMRFDVPANTSLVKVYGSVGPDMGWYHVRLSSGSDPFRYMNRSLSASYNATREVYATGQLLYTTVLDDGAKWSLDIGLSPINNQNQEGKRIEINGATFTTFLQENTSKGGAGGSWLDYRNRLLAERNGWGESGGGLSGGQIAGIVVGSVAGAIILGGLIFWLVRKNRRSKAATSTNSGAADRRGSEATWVDNSGSDRPTGKVSPPV